MLNVLDLFSGIGGFALGLDRATYPDGQPGFRTVAFCERDEYATAVLNRHWPGVPVFRDVCGLGADTLRAAGVPAPDVVCGGFPCQDISLAGKGEGLAGVRSGLWFEMLRVIEETRPRFVIAENVAALRSRGLDTVLRGLDSVGYDAEWHCIPASALGAPHRRDRVWIVAYPYGERELQPGGIEQEERRWPSHGSGYDVANPHGPGLAERLGIPHDDGPQLTAVVRSDWWAVEPDVGRVADGVPSRVDRLRCLGNAVVPQIPEMIGRALLVSISATETTS